MPQTLHRLVYHSRNALPGLGPAFAAEIRQILASSRRDNPRDGVTGALMFDRGRFGQVLEGPRAGVERAFERIQRDPRHAEVMLLGFGPAERRGFPAWSMAFVGESREGAALHGGIAGESGFEPALLSGERLYEALRGLVLGEEDAAAGAVA